MTGADEGPSAFNPRHRIAGAIVLVTLSVIVIPLLLDEREFADGSHTSEMVVASDEARVVVSRSDDILNPQASETSANTDNAAQGKPETGASASSSIQNTKTAKTNDGVPGIISGTNSINSAPATDVAEADKKKADSVKNAASRKDVQTGSAASKSAKSAIKPKSGWVVQVGTYSNPGNARRVGRALQQRGFTVDTQKVSLKQGTATRVRVGPFETRASATNTLSRIEREAGLQGVVLRYP